MYVIVLKSKCTDEIFATLKTVSNEPRRFPEYGVAERIAHEQNVLLNTGECEWSVKIDDGIYFQIDD